MVDLRKFVDIDIQPHYAKAVETTRDTVVLFTDLGTKGETALLNNLSEAKAYISNHSDYEKIANYFDIYFDNGGKKILLVNGYSDADELITAIKALDNKYICIAYALSTQNEATPGAIAINIASKLADDSSVYGINEKIILARQWNRQDINIHYKNLAIKYSAIVGAEMTMAAYLSQLDISENDAVQDYMFTAEKITPENESDDIYDKLIAGNYNVDIVLSGVVRNCGGNCSNGDDLINNFTRIILHQTLTDSLLDLLTQKIKLSTGISKIYAVITNELEKYKYCGYLTTDKVWEDEDLKVVGADGITYTIISKGEALLNGYVIKVLPNSAMTKNDKALHNTPPIYVILADQYSIRKITINGEII